MDIKKLMESRLTAFEAERNRLVESWSPVVGSLERHYAKQGKTLTAHDKRNISRILENSLIEATGRSRSKLLETTDTSSIDFLALQLPVIAALLPSLALNKVATVQALDRRSAGVFYLDVKYGQAKGAVAAAGTLIGAKTGQARTADGKVYASTRIAAEAVSGTGTTFSSKVLGYFPVVAGTVVITGSDEVFTDDGEGNLDSSVSGGNTGSIVYATGVWSVVFQNNQASGEVTSAYRYNYETGGVAGAVASNVPTVDVDLTYETVTAEDFPLRANFTLAGAIDLEKAQGLNLEDELVKYLGGELKFTVDHLGLDLMNAASVGTGCATTPGTYTATPSTGEAWVWKKYQVLDFIEKANVNIINKTLRAMCNFMVVGNDAARLIRQLSPNFKFAAGVESMAPTGPYELGTLDGRLVIHDPLMDATQMVFGYKGDNYLTSGFLYCPYVPLFSTPTLVTADLKAQKGFMSSAGFHVTNPGMFARGNITIV